MSKLRDAGEILLGVIAGLKDRKKMMDDIDKLVADNNGKPLEVKYDDGLVGHIHGRPKKKK